MWHSIIRRWLSPFSGEWLVVGPVSGYISVYILQLASVMFQVLWVWDWVTAQLIFCLPAWMQSGAAEPVSIVILVYLALTSTGWTESLSYCLLCLFKNFQAKQKLWSFFHDCFHFKGQKNFFSKSYNCVILVTHHLISLWPN